MATADSESLVTDMDAVTTLDQPDLDEGVVLGFPERPDGGATALVIDGANTMWSDLLMGRYWATLGDAMPKLLARMDHPDKPAAAKVFRERAGLDLTIQMKDGDAWTDVAVLPFLGWASTKRVAVPLPPHDGPTELRLVGGVGFWSFDRLALAPIVDDSPTLTAYDAVVATTGERDDRERLALADGDTSDLPVKGDETRLHFEIGEGTDRAAFLHLEGHYIPYPPPAQNKQLGVARTVALDPAKLRQMSIDLWRRSRAHLAMAPESTP